MVLHNRLWLGVEPTAAVEGAGRGVPSVEVVGAVACDGQESGVVSGFVADVVQQVAVDVAYQCFGSGRGRGCGALGEGGDGSFGRAGFDDAVGVEQQRLAVLER